MNEKIPENFEDKKLDEAVIQEEASNRLKKGALYGTLVSSMVASGMNAAEAPKDIETLESSDPIETTFEKKVESTEDLANPFNIEPDKNGLYENTKLEPEANKETDPIKNEGGDLENLEIYEKVMDAGFAMGIADMSPERANEIKSEFAEFLDSLPQEIKDKINSGEIEIVIEGSASKHPIAETGVDTGSRGKAFTNKQLAEFRAQEGVKVMKLALEETESITNATISPDTPKDGVYEGNPDEVLEEGRFVKIQLRTVLESNSDNNFEEGGNENFEMTDLSNTSLVIIDRSPSMRAMAKLVQEAVEEYNKNFDGDIKIVDLEAGKTKTVEDHYKTFADQLDLVEKPYAQTQEWHVWTDEYQNKIYKDFENKVEDLLAKAKDLNIKIIMHTFEAKDTGNRFDKVLSSADDLMGRNFQKQSRDAVAIETPEE